MDDIVTECSEGILRVELNRPEKLNAQNLARKPGAALKASKRLLKRSFHELTKAAMKAENEAFSVQVRSEEAKQALAGFLQRRPSHVAGN
jgi:enoyl-CoA hydratase/carnithine racemase